MAACPEVAWQPATESIPTVSSNAKANFRNQDLIIERQGIPRGMPAWLGTPEGTVTSGTTCLAQVKKLCFVLWQPAT